MVLLKDEVTTEEKLADRVALIFREGVTVCDALAENITLLVDGSRVPLFVSEEKMKSFKIIVRKDIIILFNIFFLHEE